ncbi:MAG: DUF86 domain-containing protein [Anaerolineae bacterium]
MRRDEAYLLDILIAARKAREFVAGMSWDEFAVSELHQAAVIRPLEIIGEAAARISPKTREAHPEIPWSSMIGMRNRLIHEYFRTNLEIVWQTLEQDIPQLIVLLEPLVRPQDETRDL